jgi:hypothetical protein
MFIPDKGYKLSLPIRVLLPCRNSKKSKTMKDETKINDTAAVEAAQKKIEDHKQAAANHAEAARHHQDAAKYLEGGHHSEAAKSAELAGYHSAIAGGFLNDDAKHHAQTLKQTNHRR